MNVYSGEALHSLISVEQLLSKNGSKITLFYRSLTVGKNYVRLLRCCASGPLVSVIPVTAVVQHESGVKPSASSATVDGPLLGPTVQGPARPLFSDQGVCAAASSAPITKSNLSPNGQNAKRAPRCARHTVSSSRACALSVPSSTLRAKVAGREAAVGKEEKNNINTTKCPNDAERYLLRGAFAHNHVWWQTFLRHRLLNIPAEPQTPNLNTRRR